MLILLLNLPIFGSLSLAYAGVHVDRERERILPNSLNQERIRSGLPPVRVDTRLGEEARYHAASWAFPGDQGPGMGIGSASLRDTGILQRDEILSVVRWVGDEPPSTIVPADWAVARVGVGAVRKDGVLYTVCMVVHVVSPKEPDPKLAMAGKAVAEENRDDVRAGNRILQAGTALRQSAAARQEPLVPRSVLGAFVAAVVEFLNSTPTVLALR